MPADIAVIGYDDIEFARSTIVPLSTVRAPHAELGTAVADRHRQIEFSPELVVRASTSIG